MCRTDREFRPFCEVSRSLWWLRVKSIVRSSFGTRTCLRLTENCDLLRRSPVHLRSFCYLIWEKAPADLGLPVIDLDRQGAEVGPRVRRTTLLPPPILRPLRDINYLTVGTGSTDSDLLLHVGAMIYFIGVQKSSRCPCVL